MKVMAFIFLFIFIFSSCASTTTCSKDSGEKTTKCCKH